MAGDFEPKLGDPAENHKDISRNAARLHGWTVEKWIEYIKRNPEYSLPGGVAGAIVKYMVEPPPPGTMYVICSMEFLAYDKWTENTLHVKTERIGDKVIELTFKRPEQ